MPARPDLAARRLEGRVSATRFAEGTPCRVTAPLLDLTLTPEAGAGLATQLLHGEPFTVYETRADGLAWGQSETDGYVGFVAADGLGPDRPAGRRVSALASHRYAAASIKARVLGPLPFLADLAVMGAQDGFASLADGTFVPLAHLAPLPGDAVDAALRLEGLPYLWGGRSAAGLDCSALVQLALCAAGQAAPRDSDMQAALLGRPLDPDAALRRGDLMFWHGHVGLLAEPETLIHANAHHMAVAVEPLAAAEARIAASGGGPITARKRCGEEA